MTTEKQHIDNTQSEDTRQHNYLNPKHYSMKLKHNPIKPKHNYAKLGSLGSHFTCLVLLAITLLFAVAHLKQNTGPNWLIWSAQSLPLLVFIPWLLKQQRRMYTWLCFVLLVYFVWAVEGQFMSNATLTDSLFLLLTVTATVMSMLSLFWLQKSTTKTQNREA